MPPVPRRPYAPRLPPEARRQQLLDAAMNIIVRDGYGAVSVDAIAREADVTRPVVYSVFGGLGELLSVLLDRQEDRAVKQLLEILPLDLGLQDPDAFLVTTVERLVEIVSTDPQTWRPILLTLDGTPAVVRERIAADRELVRKRLETLLATGIPLRGGPANADVEVLSHAILAIAEHFARLLCEDPGRFATERLVATISALLAALPRRPARTRR